MIPFASGVAATVDVWAVASAVVTINSNKNPVFFILPPTLKPLQFFPAISLGRQGLQPKSNKRIGQGQGYEGVEPSCPKCFPNASLPLCFNLRGCICAY